MISWIVTRTFILNYLPCIFRHMYLKPIWVLGFCGWMLLNGSPLHAQMKFAEQLSPRVLGSMPRDGSQGIIRNAFVAVGLDVGNEGVGIDPETITEENIKLYPADDPTATIKSFISSSRIPLNITLEPLHVLAPNTTYVFEITDSLKDLSGRPFHPYKISFTTSEISQPKHITMVRKKPMRIKGFRPRNDPNKLPQAPKLYAEPTQEAIAVNTPKQGNTQKETDNQSNSKLKEKVEVRPELPTKQAVVAREELAVATPSPQKQAQPAKPTANEANTAEIVAETKAKAPTPAPAQPTEGNLEKAEGKEVASSPPPPPRQQIDFPKTRINSGGKLPVTFVMPESKGVKYMIKNPSGKIVKRGASKLSSGSSAKGIDLSALPAGRYRISVKVDEKIVHHTFLILDD